MGDPLCLIHMMIGIGGFCECRIHIALFDLVILVDILFLNIVAQPVKLLRGVFVNRNLSAIASSIVRYAGGQEVRIPP